MQECLTRGVLCNGNFLPSLAHGEDALEETRAAFEAALDTLAQAVEAERFEGFLHVPDLHVFYGDEEGGS